MKEHFKRNMHQYRLLALLGILLIVMGFLVPGKFLTVRNFRNMGFQMAEFGILAIGMSAVIMTGGINLSIVNSAMLASIISSFVMRAMYDGGNGMAELPCIAIGIVVTFAVALLCGLFNGFFVAYIGVIPILVTLGSQTVFDGVALNITRGSSVSGFPKLFQQIGMGTFLGIPYTMLVYLVVILVAYLLIERSYWGISIYMVGGNEKATRFSGINTRKTLMGVYVFSAMMAAVAGILMTSRYNSARADYGSSYTMQAIAATVLGGTSITGGSGHVLGTVIAVAIIQVVSSGFNILKINRNFTDIAIGLILIGMLAIKHFVDKEKMLARK
ncbi:MAG: ABC transporter permease [Candidatus Excrementavichristensenella sp.]|jgi:simple sugar transport system permease protein|nr:ABC transporter permease [Bacillota bacterium]NLL54696.1 ABC transporter permease [Clostridiales bacterium]